MKRTFAAIIAALTLSGSSLWSQDYLWQSILSRNHYSHVEDTPDGLFVVCDGTLYFINKSQYNNAGSEELFLYPELIDRKSGLSDSHISTIAYNSESKDMILYYLSGNIDIISADGKISNVPAIYENMRLMNKDITRILPHKEETYLAGGFGLSRLNTAEATIDATYFVGKRVLDVATKDNLLYALHEENTLFIGDEKNNLQDPSLWRESTLTFNGEKATAIALNGDELLVLTEKGELYTLPADLSSVTATTPIANKVHAIVPAQQGVAILSNKGVQIRSIDKVTITLPYPEGKILDIGNNTDSNIIWYNNNWKVVASSLSEGNGTKKYDLQLNRNAPCDNNYFYSLFTAGRLYTVGGGRGSDRSGTNGTVKIFDRELWTNIEESDTYPIAAIDFRDIVSIAVDPKDPKHFFASSWGEGLFEFRNDQLSAHYSYHNSELVSALPNSEYRDHFVRVSSLTFDNKGGLWMTQGSVEDYLVYRDKEGNWFKYAPEGLQKTNSFGQPLLLNNGDIWIPIARRGGDKQSGVLVFNNGQTPDNQADDKMLYIPQFVDRQGKSIASQTIHTIVLDNNGTMWLGTDKGPLLIANPSSVLKSKGTPIASRPIGGIEPNLYYVLDNISVTNIVVDNQNNKWMGTFGDGLYLLNADGTEILAHFTKSNSPLLHNNIRSLSIDNETGLLYIGTSAGLMTYQTGNHSITKEELQQIHIYPNPVRPEDTDQVSITGLTVGMEVKVTDMANNLLYSTTANGAEVSFTIRKSNGERYASGVYMVAISDPNTKNAKLIRFAVIE